MAAMDALCCMQKNTLTIYSKINTIKLNSTQTVLKSTVFFLVEDNSRDHRILPLQKHKTTEYEI